MPSPHTLLGAAIGFLPLAGAWGACFAAWFTAFELLDERRRGLLGAAGLVAAAGLAAGVGVWAQPSLASVWPAAIGFEPLLIVTALILMVGAAVWGLAIERFYPDARGLVGGGAILGAGIAVSHGVLFLALRGPAEISFNDTPIAVAMSLASALAVVGLLVRRLRPGLFGQLTAVVCLTAGTTFSQAIERAAVDLHGNFEAPIDLGALPAAALTPIAGLVMIAILTGIAVFAGAGDLRRATRVRAVRGNPPPSPSPSQAGTGFPRPTPFR